MKQKIISFNNFEIDLLNIVRCTLNTEFLDALCLFTHILNCDHKTPEKNSQNIARALIVGFLNRPYLVNIEDMKGIQINLNAN